MNLDKLFDEIKSFARERYEQEIACAEKRGRDSIFLLAFGEGASYERSTKELERRLADDPSVATMSPSEYAFHVAELQDEINPFEPWERSHVIRLRERLNAVNQMISQRKPELETDDAVVSFSNFRPSDPPAAKRYLYTVIASDTGEVSQYEASHHLSLPFGEDYFTSLSLYKSLSSVLPFIELTGNGKWTREEIQELEETQP